MAFILSFAYIKTPFYAQCIIADLFYKEGKIISITPVNTNRFNGPKILT